MGGSGKRREAELADGAMRLRNHRPGICTDAMHGDGRGLEVVHQLAKEHIKTNMTVKKMEVGKVLHMVGTDLGTKNDIVAWAKRTGNELLGMEETEGKMHFYIKKLK